MSVCSGRCRPLSRILYWKETIKNVVRKMKLTDDVRVEESAALNEIEAIVRICENRLGTCPKDFR